MYTETEAGIIINLIYLQSKSKVPYLMLLQFYSLKNGCSMTHKSAHS